MRSTARIVGKMFNDGQIGDANVLLTELDLDAPPTEDSGFTMDFQSLTRIGFRQLPIERWTATPLYVMEFANPDNARTYDLPLRVTVRRAQPKIRQRPGKSRDGDEDPDQEIRETFLIEEVVNSEGAGHPNAVVRLRLQTMDGQDGYWRDTGRLSIG